MHPDATLTLALPKSGFSRQTTMSLLLADIAVPPALWRDHFGLDATDLFATADVVDITTCVFDDPPETG